MADPRPSAETLLKAAIGENVAAYREDLGLTQAQAAGLASVSVSLWSRAERGKANLRLRTIERIAAALQVDPALLFDLDASEFGLAYRNTLSDPSRSVG